LFTSQNNSTGIQATQAFIKELQTPYETKVKPAKPNFVDFVGSVGSLLLQFLPF
ncbi:MAG: pentapeptide repeat-containing protein, partial [Brasilonema sp.]